MEPQAEEEGPDQYRSGAWRHRPVNRRRVLVGAAVVGAGAIGGGFYAGHSLATSAPGNAPAASPSASPSPAASAATTAPDRTFVSTRLTTPHVTSWTRGTTGTGLVFAAPQSHGSSGLIMDNAAEPVWLDPDGLGLTDLRVQTFEGQPVLTYWEGESIGGHGLGKGTIKDTRYRTISQVSPGNGLQADLHEFKLTPQGTALLTAYPTIPYDLSAMGGPAKGFLYDCHVQEVDVRTGRVLLDWSALEHIGMDETFMAPNDNPNANGTSADKAYDPYHLNSVDDSGDGLLISARHTHALYLIDRQDGTIRWRLGGRRSDFAVSQEAGFAWQHDARRRDNGIISVFDNHFDQGTSGISRGLLLNVDETARTVSLKQAFSYGGHHANAEGNVQILDNGNVMVGWGQDPVATEFTADGTAVYETSGLGDGSYRTYRFSWTAQPDTVPEVGVVPEQGATMRVYASWNGATEVVSWRVLTGPRDSDLSVAATVPRRGFETSIPVDAAARAAVQALGADGSVLATSATVAV